MKQSGNTPPAAEEYVTLAGEGEAELIEKRSRFIGHAAHAASEGEALDFLARVRAEYADATHNVYAYMVKENNITRYSDAGEPQGTAGIPVLDVIRKTGFTDAVIVVTRYFGGTLLGAGGLVRAYSSAASAAVAAAGIARYTLFTEFTATLGYSDYNRLSTLLGGEGLKLDSSDFGGEVVLHMAISAPLFDDFCARAAEVTAGRCIISKGKNRFDF